MTNRESNRDNSSAKRGPGRAPVYITNGGRPAYVLVSFEEYERLTSKGADLVEQLSKSKQMAELDLEASTSSRPSKPATFD